MGSALHTQSNMTSSIEKIQGSSSSKSAFSMEMITSDNSKTIKSTVFWDMTLCSLVEVLPMFWRNILPPSSDLKNNPGSQADSAYGWLTAY
jgi:hypothetical protein